MGLIRLTTTRYWLRELKAPLAYYILGAFAALNVCAGAPGVAVSCTGLFLALVWRNSWANEVPRG